MCVRRRAAFLSIGVFLAINGFTLYAEQPDAIRTMLAVANGDLDEEALASWIQDNFTPTEKDGA